MTRPPVRATLFRAGLPLIAATVLLAAAGAGARAAAPPATVPTSVPSSLDSSTRGAMSDIDAVTAPGANTAGRPAEVEPGGSPPEPAGGRDGRGNSARHWVWLVIFFAPALVTASAVGVAGSVVGTFVLLRREALLALALPQVVAVGAAVGMRMGWPTLPPALAAAVGALLYLSAARRRGEAGPANAATVPALYVAGLCLSFLVIAHGGQHVEELQNLFTGIDVAVTPPQAWAAAPALLAVAAACALLWRRWLLLAQAPAAAELAGLRPGRGDALFLSLLAAVVLLGTASLGVVLVLAMLFLPAGTALPWARRIPAALAAASALALVFLAAGFWLSNVQAWPLSQSVGGVGFGALAVSHFAARFRR